MFQLKNIRYKDFLDIDELTIQEHSITCIVGESGSGKTTLIRLLNKMISPDSGELYIRNHSLDDFRLKDDFRPIRELSAITLRRQVSMLPQNPTIFAGTIRDNLLIGLKFSEKPLKDDTVLNDILEMVHLYKKLDDDSSHLSGGERQRLALARVILIDPEVFLLDEPSSALDEDTETLIIEKLVDYTKKNKKTLIMVTHSKRVAETYSDTIILLKQGKIVKQ